jgi:uncharacterized membrane protein YobD (UPF0266 family)
MENLIIKYRSQFLNRKVIGGIWILFGIVLLIIEKDSLDRGDWMRSIAFCLIGVIHFTPLIGSSISQIEIGEEFLKIIWLNWIQKVTVQDSEIESIILAENGVLINRKSKKPLKIKFFMMDKDQKERVYEFFTVYSQHKNFVLGK